MGTLYSGLQRPVIPNHCHKNCYLEDTCIRGNFVFRVAKTSYPLSIVTEFVNLRIFAYVETLYLGLQRPVIPKSIVIKIDIVSWRIFPYVKTVYSGLQRPVIPNPLS